jgi:hypothetical protein
VASPFAVSGFAGTTMSQLTLVAAVVVAALPVADGDGLADPDGPADADGLAEAPRAVWVILTECPFPVIAMIIPRVRPTAIGTARAIVMRVA